MTNDKLVSIIIPCYNHEKYIYKSIQSILNQTYTNIEVLVADDCSPDSSVEEINRIQDPRVKKFFFRENHGTVFTLNYLINQCSGEYISAMGSDDFFALDKIEKQMQIFESNPSLGAVFTWAEIIDEDDKPYSGNNFDTTVFEKENRSQEEWLRFFFNHGNCLCHPSALVKKSVYEEIGLYRAPYRQLHDFDFWVRLLLKYPIHIMPERLTYYRRENNCVSVSAENSVNVIRTFNEQNSIMLWLFNNIRNDLFYDAFGDLVSSDHTDDEQKLLIDKYKVLRQCSIGDDALRSASTSFFLDHIDNSDILYDESNESAELIKLFYEDTAQHAVDYPDVLILQERCNQLEETLNNLLSSKSWKLTKPLRSLFSFFDKLIHR